MKDIPPIYTLGTLNPLLDFDEPIAIWEWGEKKLRIKKFGRIIGGQYFFSFLPFHGMEYSHVVAYGALIIKLNDFLNTAQIENLCLMWVNGNTKQKDWVSDLLHIHSNLL